MQRARPIIFHSAGIFLAVATVFSVPARAQNGLISAVSMRVSLPLSHALPVRPIPLAPVRAWGGLEPALLRASHPEAKVLRASLAQFALANTRTPLIHQSLVSRVAASCRESATPFLEQVHLPLLSAWGGRLELAGFGNQAAMRNVVWGPSGGATISVRDLATSEHSGVRAPSDNQSLGVSLRFSLSRLSGGKSGNGLWKSLQSVASAGHALARY